MADLNYYCDRQDLVRSTCKAACKDKPIFCHFISPPLMPVYIALLHISGGGSASPVPPQSHRIQPARDTI